MRRSPYGRLPRSPVHGVRGRRPSISGACAMCCFTGDIRRTRRTGQTYYVCRSEKVFFPYRPTVGRPQSDWRLIPYTRPSGSGRGRPLFDRPKRDGNRRRPALAPVGSPAMSASLRHRLRPRRGRGSSVLVGSCFPEGLWGETRNSGGDQPTNDVLP